MKSPETGADRAEKRFIQRQEEEFARVGPIPVLATTRQSARRGNRKHFKYHDRKRRQEAAQPAIDKARVIHLPAEKPRRRTRQPFSSHAWQKKPHLRHEEDARAAVILAQKKRRCGLRARI